MVVWEALDALSHEFELCQIDAATTVVLVSPANLDADRRSLVRAALARTCAEAIEVQPIRAPAGVQGLADHALLGSLLERADVVISCLPRDQPLPDFGNPADCAVLHLGEAAFTPDRYAPHASLRRRVQALGAALLSGAKTLTIEDTNGTALAVNLGEAHVRSDDGLLNPSETGRRQATFPGGWVCASPARGTVHGDVVLMPGDGNVDARSHVRSPIRLEIADDCISAIDGEHPDADVLRAQLEGPATDYAYATARVAVGLNPGGGPLGLFDDRLIDGDLSQLAAGVVTLSFGENLLADRPCPQTISLSLPGRSVTIDGLPIVRAGVLQGDFAPDVYELP